MEKRLRGFSLAERLEHYSMPVPECGCWIWLGSLRKDGSGRMAVNGKPELAYRVAWRVYVGPIPEGMHVCHRCDLRACINPDHLFLGTHFDNMRDMRAKGRAASTAGTVNANARLSEQDVIAIRSSLEFSGTLAAKYGISRTHVYNVRSGRSWNHIGRPQ